MDINLRRVKMMEELRALVEGCDLECRALEPKWACEFIEWIMARFGYRHLGRA